MREIRTSGLMSGDGKRYRSHSRSPRPSSTLLTLPCAVAREEFFTLRTRLAAARWVGAAVVYSLSEAWG